MGSSLSQLFVLSSLALETGHYQVTEERQTLTFPRKDLAQAQGHSVSPLHGITIVILQTRPSALGKQGKPASLGATERADSAVTHGTLF